MSEKFFRTIVMKPLDDVAVALQEIPDGTEIEVHFSEDQTAKVVLKEIISFGHKFAIRTINKGSEIKKYGEVIGRASRNIEIGQHVHVHNLEGIRGRGDKIVRD